MGSVQDGDEFTLRVGKSSRTTFQVKVVVTESAKIRGLSGRASMPYGEGLLFLYDQMAVQSMWMVDMRFPLDIVWLDDWFQIVHVSYGAEPCETRPNCPSYSSVHPIKYAIEMNAGAAADYGFEIGKNLYVV
jgi:uncharacterized membrane protein (UPF0127 family)